MACENDRQTFTGCEPNADDYGDAEDGEEEDLDAPRRQGSAYVEDIGAMTDDALPPLPVDEDEFDLFSASAAGSRHRSELRRAWEDLTVRSG